MPWNRSPWMLYLEAYMVFILVSTSSLLLERIVSPSFATGYLIGLLIALIATLMALSYFDS